MGGMVESGGWVGSSETRDKSGGPVDVALVGAENDWIEGERVWNKTERWGTNLRWRREREMTDRLGDGGEK